MFKWLFSKLIDTRPGPVRKGLMSPLVYDILRNGTKEAKDTLVSGKDGDKFEHKGKTYTLRYNVGIGIIGNL